VRDQIALSAIASPTGAETRRGAAVAERMRSLGLEVHTDGIGNVIGRRRGERDAEPVVVCAHLDTVFPAGADVRVAREGPRLVGAGIGDNARGLAAMLAMARVIDGTALRTERPIDFLASVGEEALGDLRGAKHYFAGAGRDAHAAVILDGPGEERVIHRAVGSRRWRVRYAGPGGHSWSAYGLPNPLNAAGAVAAMLAVLPVPSEPRSALTVARIVGGLSVNAIPGDALIEIDLRSVAQDVIERIAREVRACVDVALGDENARRAHGTPPLTMTVEVIGDRPGGETPASHPLVLAAAEATRLIGREPELGAASTDANVPISLGIPAVALGAGGRGGSAHTPQEWFENVDGTAGLGRALTVICCAAGVAAR
ncbi:MAG: M20/M25/M40 family metallo-hydrolase, partial [Gemmatimonadaceae bacterium]|nr:M20/M25/M40 family metallo-hydrolase [Gemmatimonadaceae bacterium]